MNRSPWSPRRVIEHQYQQSIRNLFQKFSKHIAEITDPYEILDKLRCFIDTDSFQEYAMSAARRMIMGLKVDNARTWREAARKSMRGREIYQALQNEMQGPVGYRVWDLVRENARLISSIPDDLAPHANRFITEEVQKGRRSEFIARDLMGQFPDLSWNRIKLIARTETAKANTELTRARAEELDLNWYEWMTSEDARVRASHNHMDKVLVNWNDPPAPEALIRVKSTLGHYHAGSSPNCRCFPSPVLNLDVIRWPAKVYAGNRIQRMTRNQFQRIGGLRNAA